ncbi:MAG: long-chain fatty acid--CoA ligase [bacterium]|nr:long-chain fatty acid--CoA ligase [bacterium]
MNIATNLEKSADYFPDRCAVMDGDKQRTFWQFNSEASKIAAALAAAGVQPGDHVALCAPNSYEWLVFYFGVLKAGAVGVTFSHMLTGAELPQVLSDCQPKVLFTVDEKMDAFGDLKAGNSRPELVISDGGDVSFATFAESGTSGFQTIDRDRSDTAAILYTGGTTGIPKGAMLSHENIQTSLFNVAHHERSTEADRALCFLPLNHVFGQIHITHSMIFSGGGLVLQPAFDLEKVLDAIQRFKVTNFYAVPTIYIRMLELVDLKTKIKSIRYCFSAAASMASEVVREWKSRTGLDIHESYGMTESASMVTYNHFYQHVVGSVGTPVNQIEVQIRDFDGNLLDQGSQGEICIRGPNIMQGYLNNPAETQTAFWGDWFRSGDIGLFDDDGYLYIVDRIKDMIITGGENVYPREVEELLYTYPDVQECAVVGLPDKNWGERVTAFIVPHKDNEPDLSVLKAFLKENLAGYKVPKEFIFVEELPKNNAGKLLKREIRKKFC